jgi:Kef-type K+ transport system membrane component KefB
LNAPDPHASSVLPVLLGVAVLLAAAKLAGFAAERLRQPAVLGELLAGVVLGNLALAGWHGLDFLATDPGLHVLAELGVVLLLFEVGLESDLGEMRAVGASSLLVAVLGVVAPFLLGWAASAWLLPAEPPLVHVFIGATLCATSVGITARVLADLGALASREAKINLGAAVIDDGLGLVLLAVVTGSIQAANEGAALDPLRILLIVGEALAFLVGALALGGPVSRRLLRLAARLEVRGALLVSSVAFCLTLAWLAGTFGLAPIVGAFAAGLILDEVHFHDARQQAERPLEDLLRPVSTLLVPIFFVRMGAGVDLRAFARPDVLGLAALLTLAAVVGKLACALGVRERGVGRLAVAVGMLPRGEVGLIFAGIGAGLLLHGERVVDAGVFSAVVVMVLATTVMAPPLLARALRRAQRRPLAAAVPPSAGGPNADGARSPGPHDR